LLSIAQVRGKADHGAQTDPVQPQPQPGSQKKLGIWSKMGILEKGYKYHVMFKI